MPLYAYRCTCGREFGFRAPISQSNLPRPCPTCGDGAQRVVGSVSFLQKGDAWVGKNLKIKQQMNVKNQRLDAKSKERKQDAPGMRLSPNVGGERVASWAEAQRLAKSRGKDPSSYDSLVRQERG